VDYRHTTAIQDRGDLIERYGEIPDTCEVISGSRNGRHFYFGFSGKVPSELEPGVELKAEGGYAVLPPSIHPETGNAYAFDGVRGWKALLEPAAPPQWLLEAIASKVEGKKTASPDPEEPLYEGERNKRLFNQACKLRWAGFGVEAITAALLVQNQRRCSPPLDDDEVLRIAQSSGRYPPGSDAPPPRNATINLDAIEPNLALLNGLAVFGGRIRFVSVKRRGAMLVAATSEEQEIIWPTTKELGSFSNSQAIIADATNILLPTPRQGHIRANWEAAAHLLLTLGAADAAPLENATKQEVRDLLQIVWQASGKHEAGNNAEFITFVRTALRARRNPEGPVPPCVFAAEGAAWVHVPSFRNWLYIPALTAKLYPLAEIRNGLLMLGFIYHENLTRRNEADSETACLWRGPREVLR
jgi:hypothetical protein